MGKISRGGVCLKQLAVHAYHAADDTVLVCASTRVKIRDKQYYSYERETLRLKCSS